jgi:hypothetical protein
VADLLRAPAAPGEAKAAVVRLSAARGAAAALASEDALRYALRDLAVAPGGVLLYRGGPGAAGAARDDAAFVVLEAPGDAAVALARAALLGLRARASSLDELAAAHLVHTAAAAPRAARGARAAEAGPPRDHLAAPRAVRNGSQGATPSSRGGERLPPPRGAGAGWRAQGAQTPRARTTGAAPEGPPRDWRASPRAPGAAGRGGGEWAWTPHAPRPARGVPRAAAAAAGSGRGGSGGAPTPRGALSGRQRGFAERDEAPVPAPLQ